jgi:hypothetical protein
MELLPLVQSHRRIHEFLLEGSGIDFDLSRAEATMPLSCCSSASGITLS